MEEHRFPPPPPRRTHLMSPRTALRSPNRLSLDDIHDMQRDTRDRAKKKKKATEPKRSIRICDIVCTILNSQPLHASPT